MNPVSRVILKIKREKTGYSAYTKSVFRPHLAMGSSTKDTPTFTCRMTHALVRFLLNYLPSFTLDQVVVVGPKHSSGQYEYVVLSNWARFPIIGLVRDIRTFYSLYKDKLEDELEKEGFVSDYTG